MYSQSNKIDANEENQGGGERIGGSSHSNKVPAYPGPDTGWYTFLDEARTYLGNLRVPYACSEWIDFCDDIYDLPSSRSFELLTLADSRAAGINPAQGTAMVTPELGGDPTQRRLFIGPSSPLKALSDLPSPGAQVPVTVQCIIPQNVRQILEKKCYLAMELCIDKKKYGYLLQNAKVKHGDYHALIRALSGEAGSAPDKHCKREVESNCRCTVVGITAAVAPLLGQHSTRLE